MNRNSDGDIGSRPSPGGGGDGLPMTRKMLAKDAAGGRFQDLSKRVLEWYDETSKAGGHPEVEWLSSMGAYRVRSGPEDEWWPFL